MRNTTRALNVAIITGLMILNSSCASSPSRLSKPLEQRTLWIDPATYDRFYYCGEVCVKRFLKVCVKEAYICDYYEFSDKVKMKELADRPFVLKALDKP